MTASMLVAVTGGTGLVGSHTVAALVRAGHRLRLLVRDPQAVDTVLGPLGVPAGTVETAVADVTDEQAVERELRGADAVLHAGSVFSFDSRQRAAMRRTNARGTEVVLAAARRIGADPIVHVSSVVALMPSPHAPLRADSSVGRPREAYMSTKAASERVARRHQADGAPVVITYPPAVLGPHDPRMGDQMTRLRDALRGRTPLWPTGGFPVGDVRDTADLHAAVMRPGGTSGRWFGPGHYLTTREYLQTLRQVTGRALPAAYLPARAMLPVGAFVDVVQRAVPVHIPAEYGAIYTCACATRVADRAPLPAGTRARPFADTMADAVRWLHSTGQLTDRQAGAAVALAPTSADVPIGGTP
jgi:nucleoside-diphosphate-sugar epimerase